MYAVATKVHRNLIPEFYQPAGDYEWTRVDLVSTSVVKTFYTRKVDSAILKGHGWIIIDSEQVTDEITILHLASMYKNGAQ